MNLGKKNSKTSLSPYKLTFSQPCLKADNSLCTASYSKVRHKTLLLALGVFEVLN